MWISLTAIIVASGVGIGVVGVITNLLQAPMFMMKAYTVMASLNMFVFLFINWPLMLVIGYFLFYVEKFDFLDQVSRAWYYSFIV